MDGNLGLSVLGTRSIRTSRGLFMSDQFCGHLVQFSKFLMLSSKRLLIPLFIQFQPKFMESMVNQAGTQAVAFSAICQIKIIWQFEIFNTGPYGAKSFKTLLLLQFSSNFNQSFGGLQAITVVPVLKDTLYRGECPVL